MAIKPRRPTADTAAASTEPIRYEIDVLAALVVLLAGILAYSARYTLNPDGVSYLNLAAALRSGDWGHFVQGYWSPLYPAIIALLSTITGERGAALLPGVHAFNALTVLGVVAIIRHWSRRFPDPTFGRTALAAFLFCSTRPPRVEAVTPDLLLIFFAVWLAYELLQHGGRRWPAVGLSMGFMFLTKTSCWPWIVALLIIRLWGSVTIAQRRGLILSVAVCLAIALTWLIPVSREAGHPTLGSAGALNYCWYLKTCDSRTPDTHAGNHHSYATIHLSDGRDVGVARFDDASPWTYQPWGDPTAWAGGVTSTNTGKVTFKSLCIYWLKIAGQVFGFWMLPIFLVILVPMYWVRQRTGMWRELLQQNRDAAVVALSGLAGLAQFIAVHAEPRLIAPFVMMFSLGVLTWLHSQSPTHPVTPRSSSLAVVAKSATLAGVLLGFGQMIFRLGEGFEADRRIDSGIAMMQQAKSSITSPGEENSRLVVVGDAMKMVENAYLLNWHIVAQIRPASVNSIVTLPPAQLEATLSELFGGVADAAWIALPGGQQFQFARIRKR